MMETPVSATSEDEVHLFPTELDCHNHSARVHTHTQHSEGSNETQQKKKQQQQQLKEKKWWKKKKKTTEEVLRGDFSYHHHLSSNSSEDSLQGQRHRLNRLDSSEEDSMMRMTLIRRAPSRPHTSRRRLPPHLTSAGAETRRWCCPVERHDVYRQWPDWYALCMCVCVCVYVCVLCE
jgi:hypothetical protein